MSSFIQFCLMTHFLKCHVMFNVFCDILCFMSGFPSCEILFNVGEMLSHMKYEL